MRRRKRIRPGIFSPLMIAAALMTGCYPAMTNPIQTQVVQHQTILPPPETYAVPLHFASHNFEAYCYNTLSCRVVYNNYDFTPSYVDTPSPKPSSKDYRTAWSNASYIGIENFPPPADVEWMSLDGISHEAKVDMATIFKDQLIWHKVPGADMADFFHGPVAGSPSIFLEVNDRAINIYMKMFVPTRTEQIPGNKDSDFRDDLFLVWTHTY